jgi:hypothetical protein
MDEKESKTESVACKHWGLERRPGIGTLCIGAHGRAGNVGT